MSVQNIKQLRTSLQVQADCLPDEHDTLSPLKLTTTTKIKNVGYIRGIEYIPYTYFFLTNLAKGLR